MLLVMMPKLMATYVYEKTSERKKQQRHSPPVFRMMGICGLTRLCSAVQFHAENVHESIVAFLVPSPSVLLSLLVKSHFPMLITLYQKAALVSSQSY